MMSAKCGIVKEATEIRTRHGFFPYCEIQTIFGVVTPQDNFGHFDSKSLKGLFNV